LKIEANYSLVIMNYAYGFYVLLLMPAGEEYIEYMDYADKQRPSLLD
jgi:hypothetical protein